MACQHQSVEISVHQCLIVVCQCPSVRTGSVRPVSAVPGMTRTDEWTALYQACTTAVLFQAWFLCLFLFCSCWPAWSGRTILMFPGVSVQCPGLSSPEWPPACAWWITFCLTSVIIVRQTIRHSRSVLWPVQQAGMARPACFQQCLYSV